MSENTMQKEQITQKDLVESTGAPPYIIKYLNDCKRLPVIQDSIGIGYPTFYHPDAIQVIKEHLKKRSR